MFDKDFSITVTDDDIRLARILSDEIKRNVAGRDRSSDRVNGEEASIHGLCGESANVRLVSKQLGVDEDEYLEKWRRFRVDGNNYGNDISAEIFGLPLNMETKVTEYYGRDSGFLFMRTRSGDHFDGETKRDDSAMLEYWEEALPEAYYLLFIDRFPTFHFVAWATKKCFLTNFALWRMKYEGRLGEGYPTIGVVHHVGYRPGRLFEKIQKQFV